jgi:hypothetical protein
MVAGASTLLALAPFDIWPLALLSIALFYPACARSARARPWPWLVLRFRPVWRRHLVDLRQHEHLRRRLAAAGDPAAAGVLRLPGVFLRLARLALGALAAPRRSAPGRRAGLRCAVAAAGSLSRLVPDRFPVALRRLQPARRPLAGWRRSAVCGWFRSAWR